MLEDAGTVSRRRTHGRSIKRKQSVVKLSFSEVNSQTNSLRYMSVPALVQKTIAGTDVSRELELEIKFQAKLKLSGQTSSGGTSKGRRRLKCGASTGELRMVENVVAFRAEL